MKPHMVYIAICYYATIAVITLAVISGVIFLITKLIKRKKKKGGANNGKVY